MGDFEVFLFMMLSPFIRCDVHSLLWKPSRGCARHSALPSLRRLVAQQSTQNLHPGPPSSTKEAHFHGSPSRCFRTSALEEVEKAVADQSKVFGCFCQNLRDQSTNCDGKAAVMLVVEHHTSLVDHLAIDNTVLYASQEPQQIPYLQQKPCKYLPWWVPTPRSQAVSHKL